MDRAGTPELVWLSSGSLALLPLGRSRERSVCVCETSPSNSLSEVPGPYSRLRDASTVTIATYSVNPHWILDSLFLVARLKQRYDELKAVRMGETDLWVTNQGIHRNPAGQVL